MISANTGARAEGYFRLEWLLAVERSRRVSEEKAFLVPVTIDTSAEAAAKVPASSREVQWTKLPGGEPTPQFLARVKVLLGADVVWRVSVPPSENSQRKGAGQSPTLPSSSRASVRSWAAAAAIAVTAIIALALWQPWKSKTPPPPSAPVAASVSPAPPKSHTLDPRPSAQPIVGLKSIAVLPFADLCDAKDNTAFFSDGMLEETAPSSPHPRVQRPPPRQSDPPHRAAHPRGQGRASLGQARRPRTYAEGRVLDSGCPRHRDRGTTSSTPNHPSTLATTTPPSSTATTATSACATTSSA